MGKAPNSSSSSSIDSSSHPSFSTASSPPPPSSSRSVARRHLSTDLSLGRDYISSPCDQLQHGSANSSEVQPPDWPPIKALLRNTLAERGNNRRRPTFFVKVYMEGIPIGRKLDLLVHHGYHSLIRTLAQMFRTTILFPDIDRLHPAQELHVLTYEDKEGDWMMVGDVPWEMFLTTVKRLKISRADKC